MLLISSERVDRLPSERVDRVSEEEYSETFSSEELVAGLLVIPLHFVGKGLSPMGFLIEKNIGDAATHLVRIYKDSPLHL